VNNIEFTIVPSAYLATSVVPFVRPFLFSIFVCFFFFLFFLFIYLPFFFFFFFLIFYVLCCCLLACMWFDHLLETFVTRCV